MSWWISLEDHEAPITCDYGPEFSPEHGKCPAPCYPCVVVAPFEEGGMYPVGGTTEATLNVTYNYAEFFDFDGLAGRTGKETWSELADAVIRLGVDRDADYWKRTPGNAGHAVIRLLAWATLYPAAIWRVN